MFKRIYNFFISFISFTRISWGWNPKYRGGNVKGVG
jgi:hypothetical protein